MRCLVVLLCILMGLSFTREAYAWKGSEAAWEKCDSNDPVRAIEGCTAIFLNEEDPLKGGTSLFQRASAYETLNKLDLAIADFTYLIEVNAEWAGIYFDAFYYRGMLHKKKGEREKAITDFTREIERSLARALVLIERGILYTEVADYERAVADYGAAIEAARKDNNADELSRAYLMRGVAYAKTNKPADQVLAEYSESLKANPNAFHTLQIRGEFFIEHGKYDEAIEDLTTAIRLTEPFADNFGSRARAYLSKGNLPKALEDANEAVRLEPAVSDLRMLRAYIYKLMGQKEKAVDENNLAAALKAKEDTR
jgi:tetratricopeptide (TPR) repeat protein